MFFSRMNGRRWREHAIAAGLAVTFGPPEAVGVLFGAAAGVIEEHLGRDASPCLHVLANEMAADEAHVCAGLRDPNLAFPRRIIAAKLKEGIFCASGVWR